MKYIDTCALSHIEIYLDENLHLYSKVRHYILETEEIFFTHHFTKIQCRTVLHIRRPVNKPALGQMFYIICGSTEMAHSVFPNNLDGPICMHTN